jgi:TraY domain
MQIERKKMGRPLKPATTGSRVSLGLKVTAETKEKVAQAAEASGRTQSQEAEYRLEQSFDRLSLLPDALTLRLGELGGIVLWIAYAMEYNGRHAAWAVSQGDVAKWQGDAWLDNATAYDAAVKAAHRTLELFRPKGKVEACGPLPDVDALLSGQLTGHERAPPPSKQDIWQMFREDTKRRVKINLGSRKP